MLEAFKNESQRLAEDEDEIDLSFAVSAKHMRLFLSNDQKEELNTEIGNLVANAIRNVKAGMPVIQKAPVYRQTPSSNMQNQQQAVKSCPIGTFLSLPNCKQYHMLTRVKDSKTIFLLAVQLSTYWVLHP